MMRNSNDLEMDFSSFPTTLTIIATNIAQIYHLPSSMLSDLLISIIITLA